jgi:hypothetical protein
MRREHGHRKAGWESTEPANAASRVDDALSPVSRAPESVAVDAELHRRRERWKRLRKGQQDALRLAQEWRTVVSMCSKVLQNLADVAQAEADLQQTERTNEALESSRQEKADSFGKMTTEAAKAHALRHGWREVVTRSTKALMMESRLHDMQADEAAADQALGEAQETAGRLAVRSSQVSSSRAVMEQTAAEARKRAIRIQEVRNGVVKEGFGAYLSRTDAADREIIRSVNDEAQAVGRRKSGRKPAPPDDPRAKAKARRAAKARERRARLRAEGGESKSPTMKKRRQRKHREAQVQSQQPTAASIQPEVRFHEKRMADMEPDDRIAYQRHLDRSRVRGRTAAIADSTLRANCPSIPYKPVHQAIPLGKGSRLVAVRGGLVTPLVEAMRTDRQAIEHWLAEPMEERLRLQARRGRLVHGALHVVATWSPALLAAAAAGTLDDALAREVDLFIGRFDLFGHRVAAFLHTDSEGGNPHLHIVASRIRDDDLSLWSLPGRERAVSLWLHARSNTVAAMGARALDDDIDALAGWSSAAMAGEVLMEHARLAVFRRSVDGQIQHVQLQGQRAAARVAAVGSTGADLAGGLWLFGFGESDEDDVADVGKQGYWLSGSRSADHFGEYLSRLKRC